MKKRFLAAFLALIMVLGTSMPLSGMPRAMAATNAVTVTYGELVASNYNLSDAEKALLNSGLLASDSYTYTVPTGLVAIDSENTKITAESKDGWVPTSAVITYGGNTKEVDLSSGTYDYSGDNLGNAFSVEVTYKLTKEVAVETQKALIAAIANLKQGVANTDAVSGQSGNLYILEQAMPELVKFANDGVTVTFPGNSEPSSIGFSDECKNAVNALNDQITANNKLKLSSMIEEYGATSKTEYLLAKGTAMQAEVVDLVENVTVISTALTTMVDNLALFIQNGWVTETLANQLKTLAGVCTNLATALADVADDPWTTANSTGLLADDVDYAKLDTLVAALGDLTTVSEYKNPLDVASTKIQANASMWNVTVEVVLETVADGKNVTQYGETKTVVLTLNDGTPAVDILTAISASGIETTAKADWGETYVADKYERAADELSEPLTKDITYTITYSPKNYTVTIAGEANDYPYGYELTLPVHTDPTQAYDYYVDETYYAQGTVITVADDITFTRSEGKAYVTGNLLSIIAENYGSDKADKILNSGALNVDEVINYREPGDLESLVTLSGNTLKANTYPSDYEGLVWTPYSYVVDGTENLFNGAAEVTIAGEFEKVEVYYRLTLSNYAETDVKEILDLVATLVDEAEGQKIVMDKLAGYEGQMGQLTKNMLNGLNGVIGGYSTENGGGLNADPTTNDELVKYFQETIGEIVKNCAASNGYLKLYNIILAYEDPNNGGLGYYYQNDATVRNEIAVLSGYLNDMLDGGDRQAALVKLMTENGYGDKVETLDTLKAKLTEISGDLKPVNSAIDTSDPAKLSALATALTAEGDVTYTGYGSPYIEMGPVTRTADKYVSVEVKVVVGGKTTTIPAITVLKGNALTDAQVASLKDAVTDAVTVDTELYTNDYNNGAELDALAGAVLSESKTCTYTWTAKTYTVKIDGEADQTVYDGNLTVNLPAHPQAANGMSYEYTVPAGTATAGIYTFTTEHLKTLFTNGTYTITRVAKNAAVEKLVKMVNTMNAELGYEALTLVEENGLYTGINASIAAGDLMDFVMGLVKSGYGYIGLNNEGLMYENDVPELEISIQTLINAILNDGDFSDETIVALGENGKGKVMSASMQLGNSATELDYNDLAFVLNLTSVPAQFTNNVGALKTAFNYVSFQSNRGALDVEVNLPDQVYGAYVAALLATGNMDKTDVNALNQAVAMQFLYDYVEEIADSNMDMETFTNTLNKLGQTQDLTGYNGLYTQAVSAYNDYVTVKIDDDGAALDIEADGKAVVDGLIKFAGIDASSIETYLNMIKEYKAGGVIEASAVATLANTNKTYYALIVDAQAGGVTNKFAAPSSYKALSDELAALAGYSAVILLDDVNGDLTISGTTILDLNGKTVDGDIIANGKLVIVDSSLGSNVCGGVTGEITTGADGSVIITGGKYTADVKTLGFLKDGYTTAAVGEPVVNELYTITEATEGEYTVTLNSDFATKPNQEMALALAADLAADLALNFYDAAAMSIDEYDLYSVSLTDLIDLYSGTGRADAAIEKVLNCVKFDNIKGFANDLLAKTLDFDAIAVDGTVATYTVTTNPWKVDIQHKTPENYMDVGIVANPELEDESNITFAVDGALADALFAELSDVATATAEITDLDVTYANKTFDAVVGGTADAVLDLTDEKNSDYITVIAVALAKGGNDALLTAVKEGKSIADQKAAFDAVSVKNVFDALKALSWTDDFTAMANEEGLTVDGTLDTAYKKLAVAAGWALGQLDITGSAATMGGLYNETTGAYEYAKNGFTRDLTRTVQGYTFNITGTASASLSVKLFGDTASVPETYEIQVVPTGYASILDASGNPKAKFEAGETVIVKVNKSAIPSGWSFEKWQITCIPTSATVTLADNKAETITFTMPAATVVITVHTEQTEQDVYYPTYIPCTSCHCEDCPCERGKCKCDRGCPSADFTDLHEGQWFHASSDYVICRGLMRGIGNNLFDPYGTTTRAMVVTTLYRLEGESKVTGKATDYYTDVMNDVWYSDALVWAAKKGLAEGYGNNLFGPNDVMTREQIATFFYRYAQYEKLNTKRTSELDAFADADKVSFWAVDGLEWAVGSTLFRGTVTAEGLVLDPRGETDRSQTAALLHRWCEEFAQ